MKRIIALPVCAFIFSLSVFAEDMPVKQNELPQKAQNFLKEHFNDKKISFSSQDKDFFDGEYKIVFTDGSKIEFSKKGDWLDVECKKNSEGVPSSIIPAKIKKYIAENHSDSKVYDIENNRGIRGGYEVKLSSGLELKFNKEGDFKGFD
ncbi:MAG: PepSY-like domain-containing protein [Bacteroidales bacterium]|nr:PepSY-like domain-containing protein [Bacteroidales bacterium]